MTRKRCRPIAFLLLAIVGMCLSEIGQLSAHATDELSEVTTGVHHHGHSHEILTVERTVDSTHQHDHHNHTHEPAGQLITSLVLNLTTQVKKPLALVENVPDSPLYLWKRPPRLRS